MGKSTNLLIFIIFSILVVFFVSEIHIVVHWIDAAHQFLLAKLALVFHGGEMARVIRLSLAIIIIPLFIALIPAFIYWLFKRQMMPHYMLVVWIIWLILITILTYR